jgi:parallel beta-helix repeat protein
MARTTRVASILVLVLVFSTIAPVTSAATPVAAATTLTVTTAADTAPPCAVGALSLRCALTQANADGSGDTIAFNISASDAGCKPMDVHGASVAVCTISPTSRLPRLTASSTTIDGYTQPGAAPNSRPFQAGDGAVLTVRIDGAGAGPAVDGLTIGGTGNTVRGLSITGFVTFFSPSQGQVGGNGITLVGSGAVVQGNFLGLLSDGQTGAPNQFVGVSVQGGSGNVIGGSDPVAFNVLSGNGFCSGGDCSGFGAYVWSGSATRIVGNYIGTTAAGRARLPNMATGLVVLADNTAIASNVISGNGGDGVLVGSQHNVFSANKVGTDVTGSARLGNHSHGLDVQGPNNQIGGATAGAGNVISANGDTGLVLTTAGNVVQGNRIGTDAAGTANLGNGFVPSAIFLGQLINGTDGIVVCVGPNSVGGTSAGAGNLISGNAGDGIALVSDGNTVQGNTIGTDISGSVALSNLGDGVGNLAKVFQGVGFCQQAAQFGGSNNTIGGAVPGAGNLISSNKAHGINLVKSSNNAIAGNRVGTNAQASAALPNLGSGIFVNGFCDGALCTGSSGNTIGGTSAGSGNTVAGNGGDGIHLDGLGNGQNNLVQGNRIGVGTGGSSLGNGGNGVFVGDGAVNDAVGGTVSGAGNVIANNSGSGVLIGTGSSDSATRGPVQRNITRNNGGLGIDLAPQGVVDCTTPPPGPNSYTPCPIVNPVTTPQVTGTACDGCTVEVYIASDEANDQGHGEGAKFLGAVVAGPTGSWSLPLTPGQVSAGQKITATATTALSFQAPPQTSEFAANAIVGP